MAESTDHRLKVGRFVAAIDIGTTYSGYAYSFYYDSVENPEKICANPIWTAGSDRLMSTKNSTCILLDTNQEFHSFGFEAEDKYSELAEDNEHRDWYLFRRFKMTLYSTKNLSLETELSDITGKKVPALTIFAHSIRYLKKQLLETLTDRIPFATDDDMSYVITVPAIWDERAKQFMKEAAIKAGIPNERLRIALEPEAASIWCQLVTDHQQTGLSEPGSKYLVVDLGGGTADITAHKKLSNGNLAELYTATGGAWGGNEVDNAYLKLLAEIFGQDCIDTFQAEQTCDYFGMLRDFETKKRTITPKPDGKIIFKMPEHLQKIVERKYGAVASRVAQSEHGEHVEWKHDKLRIQTSVAVKLFDTSIVPLVKHINDLFKKPALQPVTAILLVGGFSECSLVKDAFRRNFAEKVLIIPDEAGLAVLKGAVRYGYMPEIISTRVARYAFGREAWPEFDEEIHEQERMETVRGRRVCKGVFRTMVNIDDEIPNGKTVKVTSRPLHVDSLQSVVNIYSSTNRETKYVDDDGCEFLGKVVADLPQATELEEKRFDITFEFGDTTIQVKVYVPTTEQTYDTRLTCLKNDKC